MKTVGDLYSAHIWKNYSFPDREYFYNYIPINHKDAIRKIQEINVDAPDSLIIEKVKKILFDYHKKLGLLTSKVEENIKNIHNGTIITGQQTTIFGGTGINANKIAATTNLSELSKKTEKPLVPVYFVGGHDGLQPEITTIHLPNAQSSISKPIILSQGIEGSSSHFVKTDNFEWLDKNIQIIKNIFREFKSNLEKDKKRLFEERIDHIATFLRETYRTADDFVDWVSLIYGIQANIINDWGVILLPSTHPEIRKLLVKGYYTILKKRQEYIEEFNNASQKIRELGLNPTTAPKKVDYAPFFYECKNDGYRITMSCTENGDMLEFHGKCPIDNEEYSFSTSKYDPNLSSIADSISVRLDSNQITLQSIIPFYLRVSGPGEINYHAQVIPAARKIGVNMPIYIQYTRMLYNTPWIENLTKNQEVGAFSLFANNFFKVLGDVAKTRRKNLEEGLYNASYELQQIISEKKKKIQNTNLEPNNPVSLYKSWQWGMYDENHQWQEVSYPWFIMASITGLSDYLSAYRRYYSEETPVGGIGYINSLL